MFGRLCRALLLFASCVFVLSVIVIANAPSAQAATDIEYGYNGNQGLLGDPSIPVIYYADRNTDSLVIWNYSSDVRATITVGEQPISVDLDAEGDHLYVASVGTQSIVIVNVTTLAVESSIPLGFPPASLAVRSMTELYVSAENDTLVRIVNPTTGEVSVSFNASYSVCLDMKVGGDDLLASSLWNPDLQVNITRYSLSPAPHAVVSKNLGQGVLSQVAVDWDNGRFYIAAWGLGGFQERSISDLGLLATYNDWRETSGITLSADSRTVYAVCTAVYWDLPDGRSTESWGSMIYMLDAEDFSLRGMRYVYAERPAITASIDTDSVFIGRPLVRVGVVMDIVPSLPAPNSVYGYTPSYAEFHLSDNFLPGFQTADVNVSVDGHRLDVSLMPSLAYRASIPSALSNGVHTVTVDIIGTVHGGWNFTIDPSSPSFIRPELNLTTPAAGSQVTELPWTVAVSYQLSVPEPISYNISLFFNGIPMTESTDQWQPGKVFGYYPYVNAEYGEYTVSANMSWPGGSHNYSWTFTWQMGQYLSSVYPGPGSILPDSPDYVSADLFMGRPAATVNDAEVTIDGVQYPHAIFMVDGNNAYINANLSTPFQPGPHSVHVSVSTSLGDLSTDWDFTIDSLVSRQYRQDFSILLPATWTYSKDVEVGGAMVDLYAVGPELYGVTTNLIVHSGSNWTMTENSTALLALQASVIEGLQAAGVSVGTMESPKIIGLSGHMAVQYSTQWYSSSIVQRQVILVNQESHRYWIMTFTIKDGQYFWLSSLFDAMENSFTLLPGGNQTEMVDYHYWDEFSIPVPDTWTTKENQTVSGHFVKLVVLGPVLDGFQVNFAVVSGRNDSVRGDRSYLEGQVLDAIQNLADAGVDTRLNGDINFTTVSGMPAVMFALDWLGQPITSKFILLVDEGGHTIWSIICASPRTSYGLLESAFEKILTGVVIAPIPEQRQPGTPTGLCLVAGDGQITLNWTAPGDTGTSNITCYEVYRGTASGSLVKVMTLEAGMTNCTDPSLQNGTVYYYSVRAVNAAGLGNLTDVVAATPMAPEQSGEEPDANVGDQDNMNSRVDVFTTENLLLIGGAAFVAIGSVGGIALMRRKR